MAVINIPDGVLTPGELNTLQKTINNIPRTGGINLSRFIQIIQSACDWIWEKIKGFISDVWNDIRDFFII